MASGLMAAIMDCRFNLIIRRPAKQSASSANHAGETGSRTALTALSRCVADNKPARGFDSLPCGKPKRR